MVSTVEGRLGFEHNCHLPKLRCTHRLRSLYYHAKNSSALSCRSCADPIDSRDTMMSLGLPLFACHHVMASDIVWNTGVPS